MLFMLGAVATLSVLDVALKRLGESYPPMQVTFLRGAASLPALLAAIGLLGRWQDLRAQRWSLHVLRSVLSVATLGCFVYSVSLLSLGDTYAIFMCAPLLITALSVPLLGERVDRRGWLAVGVGLAGTLIVLRPSGTGLVTLGGLAALGAATGYALSALTIRALVRTETSSATLVWSLVGMTLISSAIALPNWQPLQWRDAHWIAILGMAGALGQHFMTQAFRRAAPAVLAPLEYTALGWGMLFDWLLWTVAPNARMLSGAAVIIASGLYILHREARRATHPQAETAEATS
jgi:drug/metabolite transporter (DMT)-like permease